MTGVPEFGVAMLGAEQEKRIMTKKVILAVAVLAAFAVLTAPALAAPALHKGTWAGWGVTTDCPDWIGEVIGDTIHFAGRAQQSSIDSSWKGEGTFMGTFEGERVKMHLNIDHGGTNINYYGGLLMWVQGLADVTYLGVKTADVPFQMDVSTSPDGMDRFTLWADVDGDGLSEYWFLEGDDAIQGVVQIS